MNRANDQYIFRWMVLSISQRTAEQPSLHENRFLSRNVYHTKRFSDSREKRDAAREKRETSREKRDSSREKRDERW